MKTFNFKEVPEPSYDPVPEDRYDVKVVDISQSNTNAGDIMLNIKFNIIKGVSSDEEYAGRVLWANMSLGPKAVGFFKLFLNATGSTLGESEDVTLDEVCEDLIGKTASCVAQVATTPAGKPKNDLRYWKPEGAGMEEEDGNNKVNLIK